MKNRGFITGVIIALAGVAVFVFYANMEHEPRIQGRPLSSWVRDLCLHRDEELARTALQDSGTNHVALLLKWYFEPDDYQAPLKERMYDSCNKVISWFRIRGIRIPLLSYTQYGPPPFNHPSLAQWTLPALGPAAKAVAIPQLIQFMTVTNIDVAQRSCFMLSRLAPDSIPPLILELNGTNENKKGYAGAAFYLMGTNGAAAIPALRKMLSERDLKFRMLASECLDKMGESPDIYVPVVINDLAEMDKAMLNDRLHYALQVLLDHTNEALPAIPVLLNILKVVPVSTNVTNITIRQEVIRTIRQLKPEALPEGLPEMVVH